MGKVLGLRQLRKCPDTTRWTFQLYFLLRVLLRSGPQFPWSPVAYLLSSRLGGL